MSLVVLARHHHGAGRPPAAAFGFREDLLVRDYLVAAEDELLELGHQVLVVSGVSYSAGWTVARRKGAAVFVAGHVNSGRASQRDAYGMLLWDHRSSTSAGARLAGEVATELGEVLDELAPGGRRVVARAARPDDWTRGGFATIQGCGSAVGLCLEPFFIDAVEHSALRNDPTPVGVALAQGIHRYLEAA